MVIRRWTVPEFTESGKLVMIRGKECSRSLKHNYVGTEHLLLALLSDRQDIPARVLAPFDIDEENVRRSVIELVGMGEEEPPGNQIPFSPRARSIVELASREAVALGRKV